MGFIEGGSLIDIGCGNGRDSIYFADRGLDVTAVDIADYYRNLIEFSGIKFIKQDLSDFNVNKTFDYAYCRFIFHAVPEEIEDHLLEVMSVRKMLFIEARSDKDTIDGHYRRLINMERFIDKLSGYEVIYKTEQKGLSFYEGEDPMIIRIVCGKKA
jgi:SAM-dependent methyltransferase